MSTANPDDLVCENCKNEDQAEFYPTISKKRGDHEMTCAICEWADSITTRGARDALTARMEEDERKRREFREEFRAAMSKIDFDDL